MDETTTTATNADETTDAFMEGWDNSDSVVVSASTDDTKENNEELSADDKPENTEDVEATTDTGTDGNDTDNGGDAAADDKIDLEQKSTETVEQPKTWTLHHLDEEKTVTANDPEVPTLLQKGLDYDRIRERYDASKPVMELFTESAKQAHMTVNEYVSYIRTEAKKASGMDESEAKRAVEFEDREAAISAKEAAENEKKAAEEKSNQAAETAEDRRKTDIAEFQKTFPDAAKDPKSIPPSVWDKVKSGERLTVAFALYQVEQAKQEANNVKQATATKIQNAKNEVRSTGSMRSVGEDSKSKDAFLSEWD